MYSQGWEPVWSSLLVQGFLQLEKCPVMKRSIYTNVLIPSRPQSHINAVSIPGRELIIRVGFQAPQVGFPGGPVVACPPCNEGDCSSLPGLGRSHIPWSNWAWVSKPLKPACCRPASRNYWCPEACAPRARAPPPREAWALQPERSPSWPELEKACAQQQRPSADKT